MLQADHRLLEMRLRGRLQHVTLEHRHGDRHAAGHDHAAAVGNGGAGDLHGVLEETAAAIVAIDNRRMAQIGGGQQQAAAFDVAVQPRQLVFGEEIGRLVDVERRPGIEAIRDCEIAGGDGQERRQDQRDGDQQQVAQCRGDGRYRFSPAITRSSVNGSAGSSKGVKATGGAAWLSSTA
jgi:hypothetical protein